MLVVNGPIFIATSAGSTGTLNIGAGAGSPAAAPGTLTAPSVAFGSGTGTINFNHTSPGYVFAPAIRGAGDVNVLAGTTILTADNSYTGSHHDQRRNVGGWRFLRTSLPPHRAADRSPWGQAARWAVTAASPDRPPIAGVIAPGSATPGFSGSPMGAFTIEGNYTGVGGTMAVNTVLGGSGSASDRLVINGQPAQQQQSCT